MLKELVDKLQTVVLTGVPLTRDMLTDVIGTIYLIGNGGSAAVCSHICADMVKQGLNARTLTDPAVLTMTANDDGWEYVFRHQIDRIVKTDMLIAISSSGESDNIIVSVKHAVKHGALTVTFSGFKRDNRLRALGHSSYWCDSINYGVVEICHLAWLHEIVNPG